ncbi:MAG TPA: efflux RND transporter periplasmic adaptor subunit [Polyangiales bacterium]
MQDGRAGRARRARTWRATALACALLVACVQERAEPPTPAPRRAQVEQAAHEHEDLPSRVRLAPDVLAAARIEWDKVTREALAVTVPLPGEIVADPDRSARVASPIAGRLERVSFREGQSVSKDQLLAVVRVPDLGKLRSNLAATLARAKAARLNAERMANLAKQRLAPEQALLDALATAEALEVEARAAAEQITALGLSAQGGGASQLQLRAPLAGIVVARNAVVGQPLTADEVIADIVDLSEVWFLGRVFEKDLGRLRLNAAAEVQLNAYPGERFSGTIEYIGRQVDPVARPVTARIRLANQGDLLRVGLFGTAKVSSGEATAAAPTLVVPRSALTEVAGKPVVFVRRGAGDFELHQLTLGESAAGKVEVVAGLQEGEEVVVQGVFTLKSAVLKSTFAEEE